MPPGRPRGSSGVNKSAVIREYLAANPAASTNEVMESLAQKGIEVSQALVAGVKSRDSRGPGNKSRGAITVDELQKVHTLIENFDDRDVILGIIEDLGSMIRNLGGIDRFEEAIKAYSSWKPDGSIALSSDSDVDEDDSDSDEDDDDDDDDED